MNPQSKTQSLSGWMIFRRAVLLFLGAVGITFLLLLLMVTRGLPSTDFMTNYRPPVSTKIHSASGEFIAELTQESRIFVPIERIPSGLRDAFVAAEDRFFYQHFGVNPLAISRAIIDNFKRIIDGRRLLGASTITQQVAKNFIVGGRRTLVRKFREAIIAIKLERQLSKERILELYLNEIYLGGRAYGVGSAALRYFDKSVRELSLAEMATLASLPKAPNTNDPRRYPERMRLLRNNTLEQMFKLKMITLSEYHEALSSPVETVAKPALGDMHASYVVAEVSRQLIELFGEEPTYAGGLSVRTSLDRQLQTYATRALRSGLLAYDRRHGYRGAIAQLELEPALIRTALSGQPVAGDKSMQFILEQLRELPKPAGLLEGWQKAVVLTVTPLLAKVVNTEGNILTLSLEDMTWARCRLPADSFDELAEAMLYGPPVESVRQVLSPGDVIVIGEIENNRAKLQQIPAIEGAIIAMSPQTGRIFAMQGGWDFLKSQLNRTRQAKRQPGSAFKPFVYLTALEQGLTPATRVLDAPIVLAGVDPFSLIKPSNYSQNYYGPSTLRLGIERSRNLMTLRLARAVGIESVADVAQRFEVVNEFPLELGNALGARETTPMALLAAYAALANGGRAVVPSLIDQVQNRDGKQLFASDLRTCDICQSTVYRPEQLPRLAENQERLTDPVYAYQMTYLLQGVIERGTGRIVKRFVDAPVAGKTGTTNNNIDTWFVGYTPNLAAAVYVGFDRQQPLGRSIHGRQETGASVSAPIFASFMGAALQHFPSTPFTIPAGVRMVRVDYQTGALPGKTSQLSILEAFKTGTEPDSLEPLPVIGDYQEQPLHAPENPILSPDQELASDDLY